MNICECNNILTGVLSVADLVQLVHEYIPNKSDLEIIYSVFRTFPNCVNTIQSTGDSGSARYDAKFHEVKIKITRGYKFPGMQLHYLFTSSSLIAANETMRLFNPNGEYSPDFVLRGHSYITYGITDPEFIRIDRSARETINSQIIGILQGYGCRRHD